MFPRVDSCSLTIRYPSLDRQLDEILPDEEVPVCHRWVSSDHPWDNLLALWKRVVPMADQAVLVPSPAQVVADLVQYGFIPAEEIARREFPEELESFCALVWEDAFRNAPCDQLRLVCLDFAGPLWACAGLVGLASRLAMLVTLRLAGRYKAVATRDPRVPTGADLEVTWPTPVVREYRP